MSGTVRLSTRQPWTDAAALKDGACAAIQAPPKAAGRRSLCIDVGMRMRASLEAAKVIVRLPLMLLRDPHSDFHRP